MNELWDSFGTDITYPANLPAYLEEYFEDQEGFKPLDAAGRTRCLPLPGNYKVK